MDGVGLPIDVRVEVSEPWLAENDVKGSDVCDNELHAVMVIANLEFGARHHL